MVGRVAAGCGVGLVWFLLLQALEGLRLRNMELEPDAATVAGALLAALVITIAGTFVLAWTERSFRVGICAGLVVCMVLGLMEGPSAFRGGYEPLFAFPVSFGRGLGSISVWVTLGLAVGMAARTGHRQETTEPAGA